MIETKIKDFMNEKLNNIQKTLLDNKQNKFNDLEEEIKKEIYNIREKHRTENNELNIKYNQLTKEINQMNYDNENMQQIMGILFDFNRIIRN